MKFNTKIFAAMTAVTAMGMLSVAPLRAAPAEFTVPATPHGVTVQPATPAGYDGTGASGPYFGTAEGMTLYTFDNDSNGQSVCREECAAAWPPLAAADDAAPVGAWSVVGRNGGTKQWAFRGKPLYTFTEDEKMGDKNGAGVAGLWRKAELDLGADIKFPIGTSVRDVFNAGGQVLVNADDMTLYTFSADSKGEQPACVGACTDTWVPHLAPEIANTVGDFSVVRREDGINQWAFRDNPLYTFSGDHEPEVARGARADDRWQPAMLARYFMPENIVINESTRHGAMLVTADGYPLYAKDANRFTGGGASHAGRSIARGSVSIGRQIGLSGCDADCEKTWTPFLAGDDDKATGYWSITARPDGKRQWVYLGYAMYTFTGDEPGTIRGHDIYDLGGKVPNFKGPAVSAGAEALYWRVALP